ncbi:putative pectate lyase [Paenibacillus agaridevorans]|uniref:Putative pectate lyase n=1 Tax=Paenibacillus agaridevorans TaxID=171404 RepID=A0A2R5EPX0_9BACL|nr:stalk domain-containing protein [Paenibacillus agaridevorans]GBG05813.1 putative pectate lyase [Paenibacillus agaridevorans]
MKASKKVSFLVLSLFIPLMIFFSSSVPAAKSYEIVPLTDPVTNPDTTDEINIDFQTKGSQTAEGYLPDNGDVYGERGNGFTYGWTPGIVGAARDYSLIEPDLKLATLNQFGQGIIWEIAVPNGKYEVTVSIGDIRYPDQIKGKLLLLAEETVIFENKQIDGKWEHVKPVGQTYVSKTVEADVTDGKLTLDPKDTATENIKINYINIKSLDVPIPIDPVDPGSEEPLPDIDRTPLTIVAFGEEAESDVPLVKADSEVMAPVKFIAEQLGADVVWNEEKNAVLINSMPGQARLKQQSTQLIVNGLEINPDVRPFVLDGNRMLPVREISEAMGLDVAWDEESLTLYISLRHHTEPSKELYGWASVEAEGQDGTKGGGDAEPLTVTTLEELEQLAGDDVPRVIVVSGTITSGVEPINIGSNKTITGDNEYATIRGGIAINDSSNTIIRNLNFQGIWPIFGPADAIAVRNSHHLWFDHLNIWDASDGLLDLTQGTNYVTVSWNKFFYTDPDNPHRLVSLNGGGAEHDATDTGKNKVTYHHNWFANNTDQRMPRVLFGQAHAYNNYYTASNNNYAIGVGVFASMLVENNYFKDVRNPHQFMYPDRRPAYITAAGNIYDNTSGLMETGAVTPEGYNSVAPFTNPPYAYDLNDAEDIPFLVTRYAGLTVNKDMTAPEAPVIVDPAESAVFRTRTPSIRGTAEPSSIVTITLTGTSPGSTKNKTLTTTADSNSSFSVESTRLNNGTYTVTATATDAAGNVSHASINRSFRIKGQADKK